MDKKLIKNLQKRNQLSKSTIKKKLNSIFNTLNIVPTKLVNEKNKRKVLRTRTVCLLTTRYRSTYTKFRLSRIQLRDLSVTGLLSGFSKSSW